MKRLVLFVVCCLLFVGANAMAQTPPGTGSGAEGARVEGDKILSRIQGYLQLIDRFGKLAQDPAMSGVAATLSAKDMLEKQSPQTAIDFLSKTLPETKSLTVQRAIRIQLVELYQKTGHPDKALEHLHELMVSAPSGEK